MDRLQWIALFAGSMLGIVCGGLFGLALFSVDPTPRVTVDGIPLECVCVEASK